jgi:DNA-binding transcriptional LysR family regulator
MTVSDIIQIVFFLSFIRFSMNPSLRQMRALVALAKTGSFTLAADHLNVTQSALSGQIKEPGIPLGMRVVERTTRKTQLSETAVN